jgi:AraC-like DNA-binding protein
MPGLGRRGRKTKIIDDLFPVRHGFVTSPDYVGRQSKFLLLNRDLYMPEIKTCAPGESLPPGLAGLSATQPKPMKMVEESNGGSHSYAPQLQVQAFSLGAGEEWKLPAPGWSLIQVGSGSGYWLQGQSKRELETGAVVLAPGEVRGRVLASCLNGMLLQFFSVVPERLTGLITQGEQDSFKQTAGRREFYRVLEARDPISQKMTELCGRPPRGGLLFRLILLQLLVEALGKDLHTVQAEPPQVDVKDRLRQFLQETPTGALLEIEFSELARVLHCTPRHLSRVFYHVTGTSFREKRVEIRLARARELLATSQTKVVEVAYKSGFKSLSLFNRLFTRRFGISPGRWRQKNENGNAKKIPGLKDPRRVPTAANRKNGGQP